MTAREGPRASGTGLPAGDVSGDFLDTNVLVYAYDPTDRRKQHAARDLVRRAIDGQMVTSSQVLAEFAATLLHKMSPAARWEHVLVALDALSPIRTVTPDGGMVRRAVEARAKFGVHFYDGLIIAAAERAGSKRIWSEDLNPGQDYFGILVRNPFL